MAIKAQLLVQPQPLHEHYVAAQEVAGPASYVKGGMVLSPNLFALRFFKALMTAHESPDGLYYARFVAPEGPSFAGSVATEAKMKWYYTNSTGQQGVVAADVVLGTSPTNGTYTINATTGVGQIVVVVSGGVITSVTVTDPGTYFSPPTFTPPAGLGTGATITAVLGNFAGMEVAAATDLSAETIRVVAIGN